MNKNIAKLTEIFRVREPSHAYLFWGPKYTGKFQSVLDLAALLYDEELTSEAILRGQNPEINIINQNESIKVETIRDLIHKLTLSSFTGSFKVAIINHAENLTMEAVNILLKTIEEPSAKTVIFLITKKKEVLPETILSRCQPVSFQLNHKDVENFLESLPTLDKNYKKDIAHFAFGRPFLAKKLSRDLGLLAEFKQRALRLERVLAGDFAGRFKLAQEIAQGGEDGGEIFDDLDFWWRSRVDKSLAMARALVSAEEADNFQVNRRLLLENLFISLNA